MRGHMSNVVPGLTWVFMARCPPWLPVKSIADFLTCDHSIVEGYDPSLEVAVRSFVLLLLKEGRITISEDSFRTLSDPFGSDDGENALKIHNQRDDPRSYSGVQTFLLFLFAHSQTPLRPTL
jgi:hypothetical protein